MEAFQIILASTLALLLGPVIIRLLGHRSWVGAGLDAFVLMVIGGLVFLHILPEAVLTGGWIALPMAALGLLIPTFGERMLHVAYKRVHAVVLVLALLALGVHTFIDGVNLNPATAGSHAAHGHAGHGHAGHDHGHDHNHADSGDQTVHAGSTMPLG